MKGLPSGSLRVRLLVGSLVWILGALTVAGFLLADMFRQHVEMRFEAELRTHLEQLTANLTFDADGTPRLSAEMSDPRLRKPYSGLYWQVDDGAVARSAGILRSRSLWDSVLLVPPDVPADGEVHRHRIVGPGGNQLIMIERMIRAAEQGGRPLRLIVAAEESWLSGPVREFSGLLATTLALLAFGLVSAVAIQVSVGLAPLERLRKALASVRDGRSERLEGAFPFEVQPLVNELNAVLNHDAEVVERARTHVGNLAHALKTPLTVLANAAASQHGPFAQVVTEQVSAARKQVDYHLVRARAAAAVRVPGQRTVVVPVIEALVRVMERLYADRHLAIRFEVVAGESFESSAPIFRGEEQDFHEMVGNLLDNACKWARGWVVLKVSARAGVLFLDVEDDGPGIAPAERDAVFGRGVRADEQRPGAGLGLAIVRDLAHLYGGDVELGASPAGGLCVTLKLPAG